MSELAAQQPSTRDGALVTGVRIVTWLTPIFLWLIHIFIIVPSLNLLSGDAQFIAALRFFMLSALVMIGCFVISVVVYFARRAPRDLIPLFLNLSWLYYVKVLFYGPTIGNL